MEVILLSTDKTTKSIGISCDRSDSGTSHEHIGRYCAWGANFSRPMNCPQQGLAPA